MQLSHLMPTLMELQLPEEAGRSLQKHLENLGIRFVMGTYITEFLGSTAGVEEVRFKDGSSCKTDAAFLNCGIRPNKDFGVVAAEGAWDIYIGGNDVAKVYVGQKIAQVKTDEEVILISDRLYESYRRNGRYGESTAHFIEHVGLQGIIQAIL